VTDAQLDEMGPVDYVVLRVASVSARTYPWDGWRAAPAITAMAAIVP
jgi:hypothetical protein